MGGGDEILVQSNWDLNSGHHGKWIPDEGKKFLSKLTINYCCINPMYNSSPWEVEMVKMYLQNKNTNQG